jgi:hypothetical protein
MRDDRIPNVCLKFSRYGETKWASLSTATVLQPGRYRLVRNGTDVAMG